MTAMDREELEEIIRRVIAEDRAEQLAHPSRRERVTQFTDPDGNTWISRTLTKAEELKRMFMLVGFVCSLFIGAAGVIYKYALLPEFKGEISSQLDAHNVEATKRMNEVLPTIVTRGEFDRRVAMSDAKWAAQEERYIVLTEWLTRIEAKLDRVIERGR